MAAEVQLKVINIGLERFMILIETGCKATQIEWRIPAKQNLRMRYY